MTTKTDLKHKRKFFQFPALTLPIKFLEIIAKYYNSNRKFAVKLWKYPIYLFSLSLNLLVTFLAMLMDFAIGLIASLSSLLSSNNATRFKQIAWDCLICASAGGIHTIMKIIKKALLPFKKAE